jgi:hypothetical protein
MWRVVLLESESDLNLIRMRIKGYASNIVTMLRLNLEVNCIQTQD